jgi:hypothetical protein
MRTRFPTVGEVLLVVAAVLAAGLAAPERAQARVCSVLDTYPCVYQPFHQVCGVFRHRPCSLPELEYPFSEQLQLTIESRDRKSDSAPDRDEAEHKGPEKLGTIRAVFTALRSCWVPPAREESRPGTQLAVRLSFKRSGELFGKPRMTYVTPGLPDDVRQAYWDAIEAAVERCTPLAFTTGLGGALAGRPFAIRFVDRRSQS